jgi:hypothetical protein
MDVTAYRFGSVLILLRKKHTTRRRRLYRRWRGWLTPIAWRDDGNVCGVQEVTEKSGERLIE